MEKKRLALVSDNAIGCIKMNILQFISITVNEK